MISKTLLKIFFGHLVLLLLISGCVGKVAVGPFSGIMSRPEGGWRVTINIINQAPGNIWVKVVFNIDKKKGVCAGKVKTPGKKAHFFEVPQESLEANIDYQAVVSVFSDEKLKNLVNKFARNTRISKSDLNALLSTQYNRGKK